jgi:hypothetical protein
MRQCCDGVVSVNIARLMNGMGGGSTVIVTGKGTS